MSQAADTHLHDHQPPQLERATMDGRNKIMGFWVFMGGETVLFGTLFGAFLALRGGQAGGPTSAELFELPLVALATVLLLTSSLTTVLAVHAMRNREQNKVAMWLVITVLLGLCFLGVEIYEFVHYVGMGLGFTTNAFSSSFYALVGFHGAHVILGLVWLSLVAYQVKFRGLDTFTAPKVYVVSLYWHFVDVIWVFVFSLVYLLGKVV